MRNKKNLDRYFSARQKMFLKYSGIRKINVFPYRDDTVLEKWGVNKRVRKECLPLLITGTGRCGTHFMAKNIRAAGYDFYHERTGKDGTSSHWFVVDSDWYPMMPFTASGVAHVGERKSDYIFDKIVHLVRHPVSCVNSMLSVFMRIDYEFVEDTLIPKSYEAWNKSRFERAMLLWLYVNEAAERLDPVLRVRIDAVNYWYTDVMNLAFNRKSYLSINRPTNKRGTRRKILYEFKDFIKVNKEIAERIESTASRYGYKV